MPEHDPEAVEQPADNRSVSTTPTDDRPDFSQFKSVNEWQFEIGGILFEGSEPTGEDADQRVGEIVAATGDASLLYFRALNYLHNSPTIPPEEWQEFTASSRARIASRHLDYFGLKDFIDPQQFDELREEMIEEAKRTGQEDVQ